MAHDKKLNQRIREILNGQKGIKEQNMFGGLCFLHNGNMLCGADQKNGLMVRVGPNQYDEVLKLTHAKEMDITGVVLKNMVLVGTEGYKTKASLTKWIERGMAFTKTLPKKVKKKRR